MLPCAVGPCNIPLFDGNPERLRVDSDALEGVAVANVSTGAVMADVVGPLDFAARAYTVLPESPLNPVGGTALFTAPDPAFDQFTVASFNLQRFSESPAAAYQTQLAKASLTIRDVMKTPDIVGLQNVDSLTALAALAARIDSDAPAAGQPQPQFARVIVADYLPAGFEIDNPRLVSSGETGTLSWIEDAKEPVNSEFRDDRFSAAFERKAGDPSVFTVAYVVRAVSPGRYVLPQAYVEDMYRPDRFGRTATGAIEVTAK